MIKYAKKTILQEKTSKVQKFRGSKVSGSRFKVDGFVKSQIGSLRCPLSGVWTPAAKFQELVASASNSLEFLTPPVPKPFFRKRQCRFPIRLFTRLSRFNGTRLINNDLSYFLLDCVIFNPLLIWTLGTIIKPNRRNCSLYPFLDS